MEENYATAGDLWTMLAARIHQPGRVVNATLKVQPDGTWSLQTSNLVPQITWQIETTNGTQCRWEDPIRRRFFPPFSRRQASDE